MTPAKIHLVEHYDNRLALCGMRITHTWSYRYGTRLRGVPLPATIDVAGATCKRCLTVHATRTAKES